MIARLRGRLLELGDNVAVVDVGGVGYEVEVTTGAAASLAAAEQADLHTHFIAREDGQTLYGFASAAERDLFRTVIKVSGIGPKLALALLSTVSPEQFAAAVTSGDVAAITRVPGIGQRTASRLVVELRDRVDAVAVAAATSGGNEAVREAVLALVALGYREGAAAQAIAEVAEARADAGVEDLLTEALKRMAAA